MKLRNATINNFISYILKNGLTIMIILLLLMIGTRLFCKYTSFPVTTSIESRLEGFPSNDFYTSVYFRTEQMLRGDIMDMSVIAPKVLSATGQAIPLVFAPFLFFFKPGRFVAYFFFLVFTLIIYIFLTRVVFRRLDRSTLNIFLVFLTAFILSEPGILGIYMGNSDILLAPLMGFLLYFTIQNINKKTTSLFQSVALGLLSGFLINAKITFLPFALLAICFSRRLVFTLLTTLITFLLLIYVPNLFNSSSSLTLYMENILKWNNLELLSFHIWANHSLYIISTFFTGCIQYNNFDYLQSMKYNTCANNVGTTFISVIFFFVTIIMPFLLYFSTLFKKLFVEKKVFYLIQNLKNNKAIFLTLTAVAVAFINLFFKITYDYRLYLSIPIILIFLAEYARLKISLAYCYLSMFSLILGGLWVMRFDTNQSWVVDARLLKIFILIHFFFLILSALAYWKESQGKSINLLQKPTEGKS